MSQSFYQINDLERLTGIKAHTIRIWEKRYRIVEPFRTSTNIRYYDDAQVRKLLNVSTLLESGLKISKVAALSEQQINEQIQRLRERPEEDTVCRSFINDLVVFMLSYDEAAFEKTFSAAVTRFGLYDAMIRVIYPFLYKVGMLWSVAETMPAQEHFASCIIRRKLLAACDGLPPATRSDLKFVLFLPPEEWHDIGLIFSDYLIRSKGVPVLFLGQNVPYDNLDIVVTKSKPTHLLTFFVTGRPQKEIKKFLEEFSSKHLEINILLAVSVFRSGEIELPANARILSGPTDLLSLV
jgi:DNA-binding transcriptional MerR regulator